MSLIAAISLGCRGLERPGCTVTKQTFLEKVWFFIVYKDSTNVLFYFGGKHSLPFSHLLGQQPQAAYLRGKELSKPPCMEDEM